AVHSTPQPKPGSCRPFSRLARGPLQPPDQPGNGGYERKHEQHRKPNQCRTDQCQQEDASKQRDHEQQQRKAERSDAADIEAMRAAAFVETVVRRPLRLRSGPTIAGRKNLRFSARPLGLILIARRKPSWVTARRSN